MGQLPAVQKFIAAARAVYAGTDDIEARFTAIRPLLEDLLKDEALHEASTRWPFRNDPVTGYVENLLFYEDPDYGFVLNSLMKRANESTAVHDHAHTWTLYGVLRGSERVIRYRRIDDGASDVKADLETVSDHMVSPGYIDFVRPYDIHVEHTSDEPTVGVIFRSHKVGGFPHNRYDVKTGAIVKRPGPKQIPYDLTADGQ